MDAALTSTTATVTAGRRAGVLAQAMLAMLLGALVIGVAGFSHIDAIHNAAHDTRHSNGFPCH